MLKYFCLKRFILTLASASLITLWPIHYRLPCKTQNIHMLNSRITSFTRNRCSYSSNSNLNLAMSTCITVVIPLRITCKRLFKRLLEVIYPLLRGDDDKLELWMLRKYLSKRRWWRLRLLLERDVTYSFHVSKIKLSLSQ